MRLYYGRPSDNEIVDYAVEVAILLLNRGVDAVEYGLKRDGRSVVAIRYKASHGVILDDDRSGRVPPGANVEGATWYSFLWHSSEWANLTQAQRQAIEDSIPIKRSSGDEPVAGDGYWTSDKAYSSEGVSLQRSTFRPA
jgi:hypothetical protein